MTRNAKYYILWVSFCYHKVAKKKLWRLINPLVGKSKKSAQPSEMTGQDGIMVDDDIELIELLNQSFVSISEKTANVSSPLSDFSTSVPATTFRQINIPVSNHKIRGISYPSSTYETW